MQQIHITPQGIIGRLADYVMVPFMYLLQGTLSEVPQRTHFWNNSRLTTEEIRFLDEELLQNFSEDSEAVSRWLGLVPIFHMPIIGGWNKYVCIKPSVEQDSWFIGWVASDVAGVSRISLTGPVRVLKGPSAVQFFGINEHGNQIDLVYVGKGIVGKTDPEHRHIILL